MEVVITTHAYIDKYPIKPTDKYLILGTIHPHNVECFEIDFFYGNKNSLWNIIGKACNVSLKERDEIVTFLENKHIAVSDMIRSCERKNSCITQDKDLSEIKIHTGMIAEIKNSNINTILFTSGFGQNNAAKLFSENYYHNLEKDFAKKRTCVIKVFGKDITCILLPSPSGQANIGLSKSEDYLKDKEKYIQNKTPIQAFKIDLYQKYFCKVIEPTK